MLWIVLVLAAVGYLLLLRAHFRSRYMEAAKRKLIEELEASDITVLEVTVGLDGMKFFGVDNNRSVDVRGEASWNAPTKWTLEDTNTRSVAALEDHD